MLETDGGASDDPGNFVIRFIGALQGVSVSDCGGTAFPATGVTVVNRSLVVGKTNDLLALSRSVMTVSIYICQPALKANDGRACVAGIGSYVLLISAEIRLRSG